MKPKVKAAITATIYDVVSVVGGSIGVLAFVEGLTVLGIGLVLFGIAGFGWSCFIRASSRKGSSTGSGAS